MCNEKKQLPIITADDLLSAHEIWSRPKSTSSRLERNCELSIHYYSLPVDHLRLIKVVFLHTRVYIISCRADLIYPGCACDGSLAHRNCNSTRSTKLWTQLCSQNIVQFIRSHCLHISSTISPNSPFSRFALNIYSSFMHRPSSEMSASMSP